MIYLVMDKNVFNFQGNNMIVRVKGRNMVKNMNISSSFSTNVMSSTMNLPRNFGEHTYPESTVQSLYYGRKTSSTASVRSDFQPRNFYQPFRQGAYSQRSTYNGREGSPVSLRSIDSSTSITSKDIIQAINSVNFSEREWRKMHSAFKRKASDHYSRMAERRRKKKLETKSGENSGEQGSNSSISSDDTTRTDHSRRNNRNHKKNVPRSITDFRLTGRDYGNDEDNNKCTDRTSSNSLNPYRRDADSYYPKNIQKNTQNNLSNMLHSRTYNGVRPSLNITESFPRNTFTSLSVINGYENVPSIHRNTLNTSICSNKSLRNTTLTSQKDRFQNRFQFPSQRFNNSVMPFQEAQINRNIQNFNKGFGNNNNDISEQMAYINDDHDDDENDDIFLDTTVKSHPVTRNNNSRQKRNIESLDEVPVSATKIPKMTSLNYKARQKTQTISNNNEFIFAKPKFPVRKPTHPKPCEKFISKSGGPFADIAVSEKENINQPLQAVYPPRQDRDEMELLETTQLTMSDMSIRPSFMKRKLFTQTLDVTEKKNNSCETLATDSPQSNIYSALFKEKHRTRKLATSQSLLSRDVNQDDNNLLDLIHKIVPPSQVNAANVTKQSQSMVYGDNTAGGDKWDVSSIILTCNSDSVSDTYTDDEIFKVTNDTKTNKSRGKENIKQSNKTDEKKRTTNNKPETKSSRNTLTKKCNVVLQKLPIVPAVIEITNEKTCPTKKVVLSKSRIDAFWDTDVESESDCIETPVKRKENLMQGTHNNITSQKQINVIQKSKNIKPSPLVVRKNEPILVKALKNQVNKEIRTKPDLEILKTSRDKITQLDKADNLKKASLTKLIKTRRQINLSSTFESDEKLRTKKRACLQNKMLPGERSSKHKNESNTTEKNQLSENKAKKKELSFESAKTLQHKIRNDKQQQAGNTRNIKENIKTRRQSKNTQDQNHALNDSDYIHCKVLRSRFIDLSSSFNSDQFELTKISRVTKSRTHKNKSRTQGAKT